MRSVCPHLDTLPVEPDIPVSELVYEPHKSGHNSVQTVHYKGEIHEQLQLQSLSLFIPFLSLHPTLIPFLLIPIHPSSPFQPH